MLFAGVAALSMWVGQDAISRAQIGDCLSFTQADTRPYRVADCTDEAAGFTLLATRTAARDCVDVPGTSRIFSEEDTSYCIGDKGVDVRTAINGVKAGDCLALRGDEPSRTACGTGTLPVLLVIRDVEKTEDAGDLAARCVDQGAEDVQQTYAWGISIVQSQTMGTWDRLLCLGPAKRS